MQFVRRLRFHVNASKQVRLLAALAVFAASVAAIPVSATAQSAPAPLSPADCSNGTYVDDPSDNPGLVADCTVLVAVRNHFMSNPANAEVGWNSPFKGTSRSNGRVVGLDLPGEQLSGTIPSELGDLTSLEELSLSGNQLSGAIPPELGDLANLDHLWLQHNQLTGAIPPELGQLTRLELLNLQENQLTGAIPQSLTNLTELRFLDLHENQLSGAIPPELSKLANLREFYADDNQLSGAVPPQLGDLTNLQYLSLGSNQLTGTMPTELGKLTNLRGLSLAANQLTGTMPTELGKLIHLETLTLLENQLSGSIPSQLSQLINLEHLVLYDNQLTGPIPPELGDLTNLQSLIVQHNQLTGSIPPQLGRLNNLRALYLFDNQLTGSIPSQLGDLTDLRLLGLQDNRLSGPIPAHLGNLTDLEYLWIHGNLLSGEIPASLKVSRLFQFCPNRFTGVLPSQLRSVAPTFAGDLDDIGPSCSTGTYEGRFSDDEGNVHEDNIEQIARWGVTTGCAKRLFCPSRTVNRAQMSAFLYRAVTRLYGAPDSGGEVQLSDVADDAWYRTNARWAVTSGVMRAPGGVFDPSGAVTRADMAEMLVAAFNHISAPAQAAGLFSDTTGLPDAAIRAMEGIRAAGVTSGCATDPLRYCPAETVTRAQMASFLVRAIQAAGP